MSDPLYLNLRSRGKISPSNTEVGMKPALFVSQNQRLLRPCLRQDLFKAAQLDLFDRQLPLDFNKKPSAPHSTNDQGEEVLHQSGGVTVVRKRPTDDRPKEPVQQAQQSAKGGWQPVMGSKHAGAQKKRDGNKWVYRYPDGQGGWSSAPVKGKKKESTEKTQGKSGKKKESTGKYETTGYVPGSRAEMWALRHGGELEKDPSVAYRVTTKDAVLGGKVTPDQFDQRGDGVEPAAAFAKYQIMKSISSRPPDSPEMRELFIETIAMLQNSLAECKTADDVEHLMSLWKDTANSREVAETITYEEAEKRGWGGMFAQRPEGTYGDPAYQEWMKKRSESNQKMLSDMGGICHYYERDGKIVVMKNADSVVGEKMKDRFEALGKNFQAVFNVKLSANWRGTRYVTTPTQSKVRNNFRYEMGRLKNDPSWSWVGEAKKTKKKTGDNKVQEKKIDYHQILAQRKMGTVVRKGPEVPGNKGISAMEMKKSLGLKVVEYGHWADAEESHWHTDASHAALSDLADVLGVPTEKMGLNERVSIAIGSRGKGGKRAAAAHYEPDTHVINLTKFNGSGALAHEWGHALDHIIHKAYNEGIGKPVFPSDELSRLNGEKLTNVPKDVQVAMARVIQAIMFEDSAPGEGYRKRIDAVNEMKRAYYAEEDRDKKEEIRQAINAEVKVLNKDIKTYGRNGVRERSEFYNEAGKMGDYWQRPHEMFARCFECYVQDKLEQSGRTNTYLVQGTSHMPDYPGFYPGGGHRMKIQVAMDHLVETLKKEDHFSKAMASLFADSGLMSTQRLQNLAAIIKSQG